VVNYIIISLLTLAFMASQFLLGGVRPHHALALCVVLGAIGVASLATARQRKASASAFCLLCALLFFGYVVARAAVSPIPYLARHDLFLGLAALLVYLLTALCVTSPRLRMLVVCGFLVMGISSALLGAVQFARGDNLMLFGLARPDFGPRASGLFLSPNHLAPFLIIVGLFALGIVFWSPWKAWVKVIVAYVAAACVLGVLLAGGLGGYVSMFAGLLAFLGFGLFVMARLSREQLPAGIIFGILIMSGLVLAAVYFNSTQAARARSLGIGESYVHLQLWDAGLRQALLKPLLGTGSGTSELFARPFRSPLVQTDVSHVHNEYIELLAEYGPPGVLLFLLFLFAHLRNGMRSLLWLVDHRLRHAGKTRSYSLALSISSLSAVAACACYAMVSPVLHVPAISLLMAFTGGLLANIGVESSRVSERDEKTSRVLGFAPAALGAGLLVLALLQFPGAYYANRARVAVRDRAYPQAIEFARRALLSDPRNADILRQLCEANLGLAAMTQNIVLKKSFYSACLEACEQGLAISPGDASLALTRAENLLALGRREEAAPAFVKALQLDPNSLRVLTACASFAAEAGDLDGAEGLYQKVLAISPTNETARTGLAEIEARIAALKPTTQPDTAPEPIGEDLSEKVELIPSPGFGSRDP
jgi:tetratricopeptide (TPR) repeat protein